MTQSASFSNPIVKSCFYADVWENPETTISKFNNNYRKLTVVDLTGKTHDIEYKESRPESKLNPGDKVVVKTVDTGFESLWKKVIPWDVTDRDLMIHNKPEYDFLVEQIEREKSKSANSKVRFMISNPMEEIKNRIDAYNASHSPLEDALAGLDKESILAYTDAYLDVYKGVYEQVKVKFGEPEYAYDENGELLLDEYGEAIQKSPAMHESGLRAITTGALMAAKSKFNL